MLCEKKLLDALVVLDYPREGANVNSISTEQVQKESLEFMVTARPYSIMFVAEIF